MNQRTIRYCPFCGTPLQNHNSSLEEQTRCMQCGRVYFADPKVAVAVFIQKHGKILLTRRINNPLSGFWSLPAGFMNANEDPQEAAIRECLEETGLMVGITSLLGIFSGREHPRGADLVLVYRGKILGGNLYAGDDADHAAFFNFKELPPLAFKTTARIIEQFRDDKS